MQKITFLDEYGTFQLKDPAHISGLYLPLAGKKGLKSAVTPDFGGDAKTDQNHFLIAPKSILNLSNDRDTRNFFLVFDDGFRSVTGVSAIQEAEKFTEKEEPSVLTAGRMWQTLTRTITQKKLRTDTTIFSLPGQNAEVMLVKVTNEGDSEISFDAVAVMPLYARSADNLRDHRHVTSLLNRAVITEYGVEVKPTLSFDERGHQVNDTTYFSYACDENGGAPCDLIADTEKFLGEGGTYLNPRSLSEKAGEGSPWEKPGARTEGKEVTAALRFCKRSLAPGEALSFHIITGLCDESSLPEKEKALQLILDREKLQQTFEETAAYWKDKTPIRFQTGDPVFDRYMDWICFQPELRRLFGCSFLPHHDYGRGGRGWRDLWQDCLALLLTDPEGIRQLLLGNFRGVRMDGSNATIIGEKPGEFKGDRNGIPRVWMDHGFWPFLTVKLYMDQTGDLGILNEKIPYFKDALTHRAGKFNESFSEEKGLQQLTKEGSIYEGTVLEHLLIENLTAFYDVGEHNEIRLRNADWNDALDMAPDKGESVAFTCGYAGNLQQIADYMRLFARKTGTAKISMAKEAVMLLTEDSDEVFSDPAKRRDLLSSYMTSVEGDLSGEVQDVDIETAAALLERKAAVLAGQIRKQEWVTDSEGNGWYNGYYDNFGRQVEGEFDGQVRMMLTGQVFSVMSGVADEEAVRSITRSADRYLYEEGIGGYKLNTDFHALRTDLGRMFGFSYGDKENGAVFSHMAVMYANALYQRGFAEEGYKALHTLYRAAANFEKSRIYPGIPEYYNAEGRGLYHYLTGAASWYMMTMITQVFGVRGQAGDLVIEPKLTAEQFDSDGKAQIFLPFGGKKLQVIFINQSRKTSKEYALGQVFLDDTALELTEPGLVTVPKALLDASDEGGHVIRIELV